MPGAIPTLEESHSLGCRFLFLFLFMYVSVFTHIVTTSMTSIFVTSSVRQEIEFGFILSMILGNLLIF